MGEDHVMSPEQGNPLMAPVEVRGLPVEDPVTHSLKVLASVYYYNHWIFDRVRDFLGPSVLEIGAGIGNITQFMLNAETLVCLEPCESYRRYLQSRFSKHLNLRVTPWKIEECPNDEVRAGAFDSIVCLNVLEHIENDVDVLKRCRELLAPAGRVIILVPATAGIYGEIDRGMGHVRRYSRAGLARVFREAGLQVSYSRYMNVAGVFGWWWHGRVLKRTMIPEKQTLLFNRLVPLLSALERIVPPVIGQSLVMVGEKRRRRNET